MATLLQAGALASLQCSDRRMDGRLASQGGSIGSLVAATRLRSREQLLVTRGVVSHGLPRGRFRASHRLGLQVRAAEGDAAVSSTVTEGVAKHSLREALAAKDSEATRSALAQLKQAGEAKLWDCYPNVARRNIYLNELSRIGIINADSLAVPSVRNDFAFLASLTAIVSVLAVLAGQLPGDWGFFVPYLLGGVVLVVLGIGSTAPGLLQAGIGLFSSVFPDYQLRLLRHEAAHFLVAYLLGIPIVGYSLDIGSEHTNLTDPKLQKRIYEGKLEAEELDRLAVVSMAGLAAEGLKFDTVVGQSADLFTLQRLLNRSRQPLSNAQQQSLTRWAVLYSATLIKNNNAAYEALMEAMEKKSSVEECIHAIESAK